MFGKFLGEWFPRIAVIVVLVAGTGAVAWGQAGPATLSETQKQLNDQGVQAIIEEDYAKAIRLFQSSLALGEVNVTYLNLGRAYAKNGDCTEAQEAYAKTRTAPRVDLPTAEEVIQVLLRYETELQEASCPGRLSLTCKPKAMRVSIDGEEATSCPKEAVKLEAGEHTLTGTFEGLTVSQTVTVAASEKQDLTLEIVTKDADATGPTGPQAPAASDGGNPYHLWAWIAGGTGVAMLATALVIDFAVLGPKVDDWNEHQGSADKERSIQTLQKLNLTLFIGGGVLVATSVVLFLLPWDAAPEGESEASTLGIAAGPDQLGMTWTLRW